MAERRQRSQLIGDILREAGGLVIVFLPLEKYFRNQLDQTTWIATVAIAVPLFYWGILLEGREEL